MHYIYFLQSLQNPAKTYVGMTTEIHNRLQKHNEAVREVIEHHKRIGRPLAVWQNEKAVMIPAKRIKG